MRVACLVTNINYAVFAFVGIALSAVLLVSSDGGNAAILEKVDCTLQNYSVYDWWKLASNVREGRYDLQVSWIFNLTCKFTFQCTIGCQCNLAETNITITCPDGISIAEVEYPSGDWPTSSISPVWISAQAEDKESITNHKPITIYFWNNNSLNSISQGAFKHLRYILECYLVISWNKIKYIEARQFEELSKLRGLILDNNEIVSLHTNAFIGLDSLVHLDLQYNKIANILSDQFQKLSNLKDLYIDHNDISVIHQQAFQGLRSLEILDIGYNNIVEIHSRGFQNLTNLLCLYIEHNNITTIHSYLFQGLITLDLLLLNHNMISDFHPLQFQNLSKLSTLNLYHDTISKIQPTQFKNLSSLQWLYLDHNKISEIPPLLFHDLSILEYLDLSHNMISEIHLMQFQNLSSLQRLDLDHNQIYEIHPLQFQNLTSLEYLYLNYNNIVTIHSYQFQNLSPNYLFIHLSHNEIREIPSYLFPNDGFLDELYFDHNKISRIHPKVFGNLSTLGELHLEYNRISEIHPTLFQILDRYYVFYLRFDHNEITDIHPNLFQFLDNLAWLDLSHNKLVKFVLGSTVELSNLQYLSLSSNKLQVLSKTMLRQMSFLKYLNASSNHINKIISTVPVNNSIAPVNNPIAQVALIDLRQNNLYSLNSKSFSDFYNSTIVLVDNEASCCFITTVNCFASIPKSQFLTCGRLLPNTIQRVNMWMLGLFALLSNIGVLFYRYRKKEKENKVQLLFISNLSISDMIMGIYMIVISAADLYYKRMFPSEFWRVSFACKFAGTLSVLSSEASVFFVTLISVDRFMGIRYPFSTYRIGTKTSRILSLVLWLIAISISVVSTIFSSIKPDWYDVSEVCTGLPLSRRNDYENRIFQHRASYLLGITTTYDVVTSHQPGMYFGIAIFTALNSICFVVICVCYTGIFVTSVQTAKKAGRARDNKQDRKMATKMGAIVITDLACWAPIIILSILVQSGRHVVTPRVYTWIVTFVLPINSAINPFLYTFASLVFDFMDKSKSKKQRPSTTTITSSH